MFVKSESAISILVRKSYKYLGFLPVIALAFVVWAQTRSDDTSTIVESISSPIPVAWWLFFETSGNVLEDAMGNGHEGIILNADAVTRFTAMSPSDAPGSALHIIGNAGKGIVSVPELYDFPFESGFTAAAWIRSDDTGHLFPEGEWIHLALTCDGGVPTLYVNGIAVDNSPLTTSYLSLTTFVSDLVANDFDIEWQGDIADVRLYDVPLAQPEIEALFLEAAEFIESLASDDPESAAVAAFRALQGDDGGWASSRAGNEESSPNRGSILSPNAIPVPANALFQILTPMEK